MTQHTFLAQGLTILQTRLNEPLESRSLAGKLEVRPFVTISREAGAGATSLGHALLPLLNNTFGEEHQSWVFLDRNLLSFALSQSQLPARLAEYLPEDRISEVKGVIGELVGLHPSLWQIEHQVAEVVLQLAHVGRVIFVGRAAHVITKSLPGGFHIRLVAPPETRISRMMDLMKCDRAAAEAYIQKTDTARQRYVKTHFDEDINDPHLYDLIINTSRLQTAKAARVAIEAMRQKFGE
ncbi:MAG: cytidylate kinase-like family protein [Opitutaceae bacterium]|nr:cytidylate kinase-like family protein [Opitutaceae bacterium]